jgi:hypothetical protein
MVAGAHVRFVSDESHLENFLTRLKLLTCPHCGRAETLNAHGPLRGYVERGSEFVVRGWRVYCANRGRRRGCGRTFSALLAEVLWGFVTRAETLLGFVLEVLGGASRATAWRRVSSGSSLRNGYRLWKRLSEEQPRLRSLLCRHTPPVSSESREPLQALRRHLEAALPQAEPLFASFQVRFQQPLLG